MILQMVLWLVVKNFKMSLWKIEEQGGGCDFHELKNFCGMSY